MFEQIKSILKEILSDAKALGRAKLELLELDLVEQAIPKVSRGIHASAVLILLYLSLIVLIGVLGFAFSLLFVPSGSSLFLLLRALTLGFLCLWGLFFLVILILYLTRNSIYLSIEARMTTNYLTGKEKMQNKVALQDNQLTEEEIP